jgi:hypothetical protein
MIQVDLPNSYFAERPSSAAAGHPVS